LLYHLSKFVAATLYFISSGPGANQHSGFFYYPDFFNFLQEKTMTYLTHIPPNMGTRLSIARRAQRNANRSRAGSLRFVCGLARPPST
jgi:hypothetical protein